MKKIKTLLFTIALCVSSSSLVFAATNEGNIKGEYQTTRNGKQITTFETSPEIIKKEEEKTKLAEIYTDYSDGIISKGEYENKVKQLDVSDELRNFEMSVTNEQNELVSTYDITNYKYISDLYQQTQQNYYYCGPATAASILSARLNTTYQQSYTASSLRTTVDGTSWYDGAGKTGYPMADTLNLFIGSDYYLPYGTSVNAEQLNLKVRYDIDRDYGLAGNAWQVPGGPHLAGHPGDQTIFHWVAIDGYSNQGNSIHYADSAANASSISWGSNVPKYSTINTSTLAIILDGRGLIW